MKRSQKGSAIIWAMAVIMLLMVLVSAVLSLALPYAGRAMKNNQYKQAYFTARSAVNMLAEQVNDEVNRKELVPEKAGQSITITDVALGEHMGSCSAVIQKTKETVNGQEEERLVITATAKVAAQSYTMKAVLAMTDGPGGTKPEPEPPKVDKYFKNGVYFTNFALSDNNGSILGPFETEKDTDVYFFNQEGTPLSFSGSKRFGYGEMGGPVTLRGNVLCNQGISFSGDADCPILVQGDVISSNESDSESIYAWKYLEIGDHTTVKGDVYARGVLKLLPGAVVEGNIIAREVEITDPSQVTIKGSLKTLSGKVKLGSSLTEEKASFQAKNGTVTVGTQASFPNILPTITLPEYLASGDVKNASTLTAKNVSAGLQGGKTYIVSGNVGDYKEDITVSGTGNVYVYVPKGANLSFRTLADQETNPRVYFILEDEPTSKLYINSTGYSTETGTSEVTCNAHIVGKGQVALGAGTTLRGSVTITPGYIFSVNQLYLQYVEPEDKTYVPTIESNDNTIDGIFGGSDSGEEEEAPLFTAGVYSTSADGTDLQNIIINSDYYYNGSFDKALGFRNVTFSQNLLCKSNMEVQDCKISGQLVSDGSIVFGGTNTVDKGVYTKGKVSIGWGNTTFGGGITAKEIDFGSSSPKVSGELRTESGAITWKGAKVTEYGGIRVQKLPAAPDSRLPAYTPPTIARPTTGTPTALTQQSVNNSKSSPVGDSGSKDTYYSIASGAVNGGNLYVQGTGNIFIFLDNTNDTPIRLSSIRQAGEPAAKTHVYFILGDNVKFYLEGSNNNEYYAHIVGTGEHMQLSGTLYGAITISARLQFVGGNTTVENAESDIINGGSDPQPPVTQPTDVWKIMYYEKVEE